VGLFGIGEPPSGSRDPFGLRRASLGIIRIILERQLDLPVSVILASARAAHGDQHETDEVLEYLQERLRHHLIDSGVEADVVYAAFGAEAGIESMVDTGARVKALNDFRSSSAGIAATASNKRVSNILSKAQVSGAVDASLFEDAAEIALAEQLTLAQDEISAAPGFSERLTILAGLQPHLDQFFDDVIVMTEVEALRNNRLALLQSAREMFLTVGDLSELQG
jgi:glycyl-tRNA synthetase beta chain